MRIISLALFMLLLTESGVSQIKSPNKKPNKNIENIVLAESVQVINSNEPNISTEAKQVSFSLGKKRSLLLKDTTIILARSPKNGLPTFIQKKHSLTSKIFRSKSTTAFNLNEIKNIAINALSEISNSLKLENPGNSFNYQDVQFDENGNAHIKMNQHINNIPIYGAEVNIHINKNDESVVFNGNYYAFNKLNINEARIQESNAIKILEDDLMKKHHALSFKNKWNDIDYTPEIEKVILPEQDQKTGKLCYHITYWPSQNSRWEYFINANDGNIIRCFENICSLDGPSTVTAKDLNGISRTVGSYVYKDTAYLIDVSKSMYNKTTGNGIIKTYDLKNDTSSNALFYTIYSKTNTWDAKAISAHYNASLCFDYYKTVHNRNSIDDKGMNIYSVINVADDETGKGLDNAYWNGKAMFYGNGSTTFKALAGAKDVAGHEMTHGVVQFTANLEYEAQPGAINESMADIFGYMIDTSNWYMGEDVILDKVNYPTGALRSLSDPHNGGKKLGDWCWQPNNMSEYYTGEADNYGVHLNSGIPNYAFYKIASAIGKIKTAKIYYQALSKYLVKLSQFLDLRLAVIQSAKDLYTTADAEIIAKVFDSVGIVEATVLDKVSDLKTNPGTEYILTYDTDRSDANGIYRRTSTGISPKELTNKTVASRPSITDNGKSAVFVGTDSKIYSLVVDPTLTADKTVIQNQAMWSNVAISKDGKRLAAVTKSQDTSIYVYDYGKQTWYRYMLYAPTFTTGIKSTGPLYADGIEWDYTGQNLIFDCFNKIKDASGKDITYWDINIINVWNNNTNSSTDGKISKLFSLSEGDNVGNPTFSKNSPQKIAFDYFNELDDLYGVIGYDIAENTIDVISINNTLGFPSYDKLDGRVAFGTDSSGIDVVKYVNINKDKISSSDIPKKIVNYGKWPVFYAVGNRNVVIPPTPVITTGSTTVICTGQTVTLTSSSNTGNQWYKNGAKISSATSKNYIASETGSYSVIVTQDSVASPPSSAITVIANLTPAKPTITRDVNGYLLSSSQNNNLWMKENTLTGDTTQKYKPQSNGYYSVKVTKNGCTSSSSDSYYYLTNAVQNIIDESKIVAYPNPNQNKLYIKGKLLESTNQYTIMIIDMNGRVIIQQKRKGINSLDIETLQKGKYILQIKDMMGRTIGTQIILKD